MHRNCLISNPSTSLKAGFYFDLSWSMNNTLRQFNEAMDNHHFYTEKSACWSVDLQTGHGFAMISSFTWDSNCYEWTRYGPSSLQTKPFKHQIMFYTIIGCYKSQCILNKHSYNYQGVKHFLTSTSTTFSTSCALVRHLGPPGSIETSIVHNSRVCTWKPGHTGTGSQKIGTFGDLIEMCEYDWTCLSLWNLYCIILYIRPCAILRHLPLLQQSQPSYAS